MDTKVWIYFKRYLTNCGISILKSWPPDDLISCCFENQYSFHFQCGWTKNEEDKTLSAISLPDNVKAIPEEISRVLACNCQAEEPCKRGNCSCKSLQISCTVFCKCRDAKCANPWTVSESEDVEGELFWLLRFVFYVFKCICRIKLDFITYQYFTRIIYDVTVKGTCKEKMSYNESISFW